MGPMGGMPQSVSVPYTPVGPVPQLMLEARPKAVEPSGGTGEVPVPKQFRSAPYGFVQPSSSSARRAANDGAWPDDDPSGRQA